MNKYAVVKISKYLKSALADESSAAKCKLKSFLKPSAIYVSGNYEMLLLDGFSVRRTTIEEFPCLLIRIGLICYKLFSTEIKSQTLTIAIVTVIGS